MLLYELPPLPSSPLQNQPSPHFQGLSTEQRNACPFRLYLLFKQLFPVSFKESEAGGMEKSQKLDLAVGLARFRKLGK